MNLLHHTDQIPTIIHLICRGRFSGPKFEELVIVRGGTWIELLRPDTENTGRCKSLAIKNTYSTIFQVSPLRFTGDLHDHLIVTSDSGCLVILKFEASNWKPIITEAIGKSGYRRSIPGSLLAVDPLGRAFLISALEKNKIGFTFMKDEDGEERTDKTTAIWQLSSPMEANRPGHFTEHLCALNVGNENPIFAALETTKDVDVIKKLVFYQVNLGLNLLTRKSVISIPTTIDFIHPFESGILLADQEYMYYHRLGLDPVKALIPQRQDSLVRAIIVNSTSVPQLTLVQADNGDLFKISYSDSDEEGGEVLKIIYFDTIPPALDLCLLTSGFLFVASERTDHALFQLDSLGSDENTPNHFIPRSQLSNLICVSTLVNYGMIAKALKVNNQWHLVKGREMFSSLCILNDSLPISSPEILDDTRKFQDLLPLDNLILPIEYNGRIQGFDFLQANEGIMGLRKMANGTIVQVTKEGFHVFQSNEPILQWLSPLKIEFCVLTEYQAVMTAQAKLILFELDQVNILREVQVIDFDQRITAIALAPIPSGSKRGPFIAVGTMDRLITLLSLHPTTFLQELVSQVCASCPQSLLITEHSGYCESIESSQNQLFLHTVLDDGVYVRLTIDSVSGELAAPMTKRISDAYKVSEEQGKYVFGDEELNFHQVIIHCKSQHEKKVYFYSPGGSLQFIDKISSVHILQDVVYALNQDDQMVKFPWPFLNQDALYSRQLFALPQTGRQLSYDPESGLLLVGLQSSLLIYSTHQREFVAAIPVNVGETLTSMCLVRFASRSGGLFLAMASARDLILMPRQCTLGVISVYLLQPNGSQPTFIHRTEFESTSITTGVEEVCIGGNIPMALTNFAGKLLCSIGSNLRLYDLGKQKLLLKCSTTLPSFAVHIKHQGLRLSIADAHHSLLIYYYRPDDNRFYLIADDMTGRPLTYIEQLDYDTFALADRLGGITFLGLSRTTSQEIDSDPSSSILNQPPCLYGAPIKLERLAYFYVGQIVTGLYNNEVTEGNNRLEYVTLQGGMGTLHVIRRKSQLEVLNEAYQAISIQPRQSLTASCIMAFRSRYFPAKNVIDADVLQAGDHGKDENRQIQDILEQILH